jgi:sugar phosphate isomerase/epimerase
MLAIEGRGARDVAKRAPETTAGLHNHMGQMVQNRDEVDRFMSMTDPKLFGFSPDTCHLNLAGCDVVGTH